MQDITLGQIAGLIVALAFCVLVFFSIRPLLKLSGVLDRMAESLRQLTEHTLPAIDEAAKTVAEANNQVKRLDTITAAAARTTEDISAMTTLVTSTVGAPFLAARRGAEKVKEKFSKKSDDDATPAPSARTSAPTAAAADSATEAPRATSPQADA